MLTMMSINNDAKYKYDKKKFKANFECSIIKWLIILFLTNLVKTLKKFLFLIIKSKIWVNTHEYFENYHASMAQFGYMLPSNHRVPP